MRAGDAFRNFFSRWILGWIPFGAASALILHGAFLSPDDIPKLLIHLNDKVVHGMEYFVLFLFSANAFRRAAQAWLTAYPDSLAFGYCLMMGIVTEIAQFWAPGRMPDIFDWAMDGLGAAAAWTLIFLIALGARLFSKRNSHELL